MLLFKLVVYLGPISCICSRAWKEITMGNMGYVILEDLSKSRIIEFS